jgi:hypothetical protein
MTIIEGNYGAVMGHDYFDSFYDLLHDASKM